MRRTQMVVRFKVARQARAAEPPKRPFRDPDALEILSEIASALRSQGVNVSEVRPGHSCDAGARCKINQLDAELMLMHNDTQGGEKSFALLAVPTEGGLWTMTKYVLGLYRPVVPPAEEWKALGELLERQIRLLPGVSGVNWRIGVGTY